MLFQVERFCSTSYHCSNTALFLCLQFQVMSCLAQEMKSYPDIIVLSLEEDREFQECLSRLETVRLELGENDPNFLPALLDVANCLSYRGRYEEAWDKYNTVYTALEGNKQDSSNVIFAMCLPAFASCKPEILHAYINMWQQRLADPNGVEKSTVRILPEIMTRLKNVGKKDRALELYDQLYTLLVADRGEAHPLTVSAQLTCHMLSKLEDELRHCDDIYFNVVSTRGEADPKALQVLLHKAWRLWYLNRKIEALEIYEKVHSTAVSARGENDYHALRAQLHKAECWSELDAQGEAWQLYLAVCKQWCDEEPLPMPEEVADMQQIFRDLRRKIKTRQYGRDVPTTISESIHDLQ